jgi:hypothetical protein
MYHVDKEMQKVIKVKSRGERDTMGKVAGKAQRRGKGKEMKFPHFSNFLGTRSKGKERRTKRTLPARGFGNQSIGTGQGAIRSTSRKSNGLQITA